MQIVKGYKRDPDFDTVAPEFVELELRDLFAAFALAGLSSMYPQGGKSYAATIAPMAYEIADEMLKAREAKGE